MSHADHILDRNVHINSMTNRIIWGSIFLCTFTNLALLANGILYAFGGLDVLALFGFAKLVVKFHVACFVISMSAILMSLLFSFLDRKGL